MYLPLDTICSKSLFFLSCIQNRFYKKIEISILVLEKRKREGILHAGPDLAFFQRMIWLRRCDPSMFCLVVLDRYLWPTSIRVTSRSPRPGQGESPRHMR
jgi:hypothetical protein